MLMKHQSCIKQYVLGMWLKSIKKTMINDLADTIFP